MAEFDLRRTRTGLRVSIELFWIRMLPLRHFVLAGFKPASGRAVRRGPIFITSRGLRKAIVIPSPSCLSF